MAALEVVQAAQAEWAEAQAAWVAPRAAWVLVRAERVWVPDREQALILAQEASLAWGPAVAAVPWDRIRALGRETGR